MQNTPPLWRDLVKILTTKLWHTTSFSLERTDIKNVIFENIPWAPSEVAKVAEVKRPQTQNNENSKWKPIKNRWNPNFGLGDLENGLGDLEDLRGGSVKFSKKYFLNQGKALRKMSYSFASWSNF